MANLNRPFGVRPVRKMDGAAWSGEANIYVYLAAETVALRIGDLVKQGSTSDAAGVPNCVRYSVTESGLEAPLGPVVGIMPVNVRPMSLVGSALGLEETGILAGEASDRYVLVCDSTEMIFEAQADATGLSRNVVGSNVDITNTQGPAGGISAGVVLTQAGGDTPAATLPYRLMGFSSKPTNEIPAAVTTEEPFIICLLRPNEHAFRVGKAGRIVD